MLSETLQLLSTWQLIMPHRCQRLSLAKLSMDTHFEVQVLLQAVETEGAQAGGCSSPNDEDLPPYTPQQRTSRSNEPSER